MVIVEPSSIVNVRNVRFFCIGLKNLFDKTCTIENFLEE